MEREWSNTSGPSTPPVLRIERVRKALALAIVLQEVMLTEHHNPFQQTVWQPWMILTHVQL